MMQLGLSSFRCEMPSGTREALRAEFDEYHAFHIRNFLAPELLAFVHQRLPDTSFRECRHGDIGVEMRVDAEENIGVQCLQLRMNDRQLTDFLESATGIVPLQHFGGRAYRMTPGAAHYDSWHNDIANGRRLGVSINLSPAPYQGGTFVLRRSADQQVIRPMPNLGHGDANFFRIDKALEHMVTPVLGTKAKTAFAGWFHETENIADCLRNTPAAAKP